MEKQFWVIYDDESKTYLRDNSLRTTQPYYYIGDGVPLNFHPPIHRGFEMTSSVFEAKQFDNYDDYKTVCHIQVYYPKARYIRVNLTVHIER